MTQKLTPKQERFCQKYIELGSAADAYRAAYNAENMKPVTIRRKAAELLAHGSVSARVRALQAEHQRRHEVTVDSLTTEYEEARRIAIEDRQAGAAVSATTGKAKLHGLLSDTNVSVNVSTTPLSEQDRALLDEYAGRK